MRNPLDDLPETTIIPLIDVLLVLMCFLMLMIPAVGSKLPLEITPPATTSAQPLDRQFITLEITEDGRTRRVDLATRPYLTVADFAQFENKDVLLAADQSASWTLVSQTLAELNRVKARVSVAVVPTGTN